MNKLLKLASNAVIAGMLCVSNLYAKEIQIARAADPMLTDLFNEEERNFTVGCIVDSWVKSDTIKSKPPKGYCKFWYKCFAHDNSEYNGDEGMKNPPLKTPCGCLNICNTKPPTCKKGTKFEDNNSGAPTNVIPKTNLGTLCKDNPDPESKDNKVTPP